MRVCVCESVKHRCFTGFSKVFPKFFQTPEKSFPNGFLVILKLNRFKFGKNLEKFWKNFGKDLSLSLFCSISKFQLLIGKLRTRSKNSVVSCE